MSHTGAVRATERVDEAALVARLKAGDEHAFETIVRTYSGRLLAVARRLVGNEDDARDALQDAFISAYGGIRSFEGESQLSTWLHRITVNSALMKLRTRRRKAEEPIDGLLPGFLEDGHHAQPVPSWRASADELLEQKETRAMVRQSIDRLPESYRTVILLRDIEELSTEETARILGITANAVKIRLHRARQTLATVVAGTAARTGGSEEAPPSKSARLRARAANGLRALGARFEPARDRCAEASPWRTCACDAPQP